MADVAYLMNESLSPTKLNSKNPLSPSKYPDKRSMANAYKRSVQTVMDSPEDRHRLHKMLKEFHKTLVVEDLMEKLKLILNHPQRRKLYLVIRPLIPARLRAEYNSLIPFIPSYEKKVVHLRQVGSRSMGFNIRGGKEFGCGVFVSSVIPSSKANQAGLKVGDEVIRINGLILSESTHEEVVSIMTHKKSLTLTVKCVGMIPVQDVLGGISWKEVEERKSKGPVNPMRKLNSAILRSTKKIQVTLREGESLGVSIKTTHDKSNGVFISEQVPNSKAYDYGLKIGDEMIEVNGQSLIDVPHREAVKMLKSSHSLMLTIRNRDPTMAGHMSQYGYDSVTNPPEDFEINPHEIDMDAELIPTDMDTSYGFVLRSREDGKQPTQQEAAMRAAYQGADRKRLSLTDMEMIRNTNAPVIASPAAYGFGPSVAMPAILGMMPDNPNLDETEGSGEGEESVIRYLEEAQKHFTPQQMAAVRESMAFPNLSDPPSHGGIQIDATFFANNSMSPEKDTPPLGNAATPTHMPAGPPPTAPKPKKTSDFSSYQFPVEDDDATPTQSAASSGNQHQMSSALRKEGVAKKKTPAFQENVEIINARSSLVSSNSAENLDTVHPSNMEFTEKVLQGRQVKFHSVPKDGPIKIAIRGGIDTPLGGAIIISRIIEGGAAERYGRLNVGDQILICDGERLFDVTHDEAAHALKKAMDMDSRYIDLVVAVNPDAENSSRPSTPQTIWPPHEDTVCDDQPATSVKGHDYAMSSHRAHSGFTMRGGGVLGGPHSFLPKQ